MVPRELYALLASSVLTALCVATSASAAAAPSIDFDFAAANGAAAGDYELLADNEERAAGERDDDNNSENRGTMHHHHHQQQHHRGGREVRCYCNQPHCVSQGYMCRGQGCFTELPLPIIAASAGLLRSRHEQQRPEHAAYSGCLEKSFAERPCPQGKLCCEQDLCNHVDSPAMRSRLNKTLQVLLGEHRTYFGSMQPAMGQEVQTSDGWFKTATIAVPICGFVVLLILASLAIRLLQPVPSQGDKLNGLRMPENAPPLLGPQKLPLV